MPPLVPPINPIMENMVVSMATGFEYLSSIRSGSVKTLYFVAIIQVIQEKLKKESNTPSGNLVESRTGYTVLFVRLILTLFGVAIVIGDERLL